MKKVSARSGGKNISLFYYSCRNANTIQCPKTALANVILKETFKTPGLQRLLPHPRKVIFKIKSMIPIGYLVIYSPSGTI